jgi:peroxiredoxin
MTVILKFTMRSKILLAFSLVSASVFAASLPRKSPEFTVKLPDGKKVLVSSYKGKVLCLAFILTTCPHCQKATQVLSVLHNDLKAKGFEVLGAALNDDPQLPAFTRQFKPSFPVGTAGQTEAIQYMQLNPSVRTFMPYIAFIDRKGMIRAFLTGGDLKEDTQATVLRQNAEKLLNESTKSK